MTEVTASLNYGWASCIIEELCRNGITHFCLSPGSRCTPLTAAVAYHKTSNATVHFDERGTGFFAIGLARAINMPTVLVSTSGTAVANYFPAIVEAAMDCVPLILLTADRPPELRQTDANQTIDQVKIFANYVRWQFDVPCPTPEIPPEMILTTIDQAVHHANRLPSGPVHLNCMFREPFLPISLSRPDTNNDAATATEQELEHYWGSLSKWRRTNQPYTAHTRNDTDVPKDILRKISALIRDGKTGATHCWTIAQ